jgi:hypothetical protein
MSNIDTQPDISQIRAALQQIVSDVIGEEVSQIESDVPILDIITSSLALVEGMRRVYERFGVLVSIRYILEGEASLNALAVYIDQTLVAQKASKNSALAASNQNGRPPQKRHHQKIPLAPSQQHVGFLTRYSSDASAA